VERSIEESEERQKVTVEVGGRRLEVVLPGGLGGLATSGGGARKPRRSGGKKAGAAASGDSVTSPMQGTIVKVVVEEGQSFALFFLVRVLLPVGLLLAIGEWVGRRENHYWTRR
jgi:acetyl/propionyl-CoA carboxylase alpha subunit